MLQAFVDNVKAATVTPHRIVFVVELHDRASHEAAEATGATTFVNTSQGGYSDAIQTAYTYAKTPYFLAANDDFDFQPGWDIEAMKLMGRPGRHPGDPKVQVVGIDDGAPVCEYSTIFLVDRTYIEQQSGCVDIQNRVLYPYQHNYSDTEFFRTAVKRGVFAAAPKSKIIHRHPDWGLNEIDDTYRKGQGSVAEDGKTFNDRSILWR
jgi:hypothetical protein